MDLKFFNTLSSSKEQFVSISKDKVLMYNCGPTVYDRQHIGNLSMFVFTDILRKTLEYAGYEVNQVINITDFGHLSGDNIGKPDEGEDRMTKGLKREGLELTLENMKTMAQKYASIFFNDIKTLNIDVEKINFPFASDYIESQIKMIEKLIEKGSAYITPFGVYFDTKKFDGYGKLGNINFEGLEEGARIDDTHKKNYRDFVLWKSDPNIGWQSPWGLGFPGWHIECSAMIIKILGKQIDIHTGGMEHIGVHHNNEIAQSESFTGLSPFSRFWLHREHLKVDNTKIGKSNGNAIYIDDLLSHGIHPTSFRYFLMMSHYKTPSNFTWESIEAAQKNLEKIVLSYDTLKEEDESDKTLKQKFEEAISDDLNTPQVIAILQEAKSKNMVDTIDKVIGISIKQLSLSTLQIDDIIKSIKEERETARQKKDWQKSDELRSKIESYGYIVEDKTGDVSIRKTMSQIAKESIQK
jgi:cysteinyl-tRNA synthetase